MLEKIGLSKAEINVYLALLRLGPVPSNRIIQETSSRKSTVYDSIRRLQEKGLISSAIRDKKTYFEATPPDRLVEFIQDRKRELDGYESEAAELVKSLEKEYGNIKPHAEAHILLGIEGFKTMRRDVLKHATGELLILGGIGREFEAAPSFLNNWNKTRLLKGIKQVVLAKKSFEGRRNLMKKYLIRDFEARFLPKELEGPAVMNIYGDRVATVIWNGNYPICFLLINKETAAAYKGYFNYLWKLAK